MHRLRDLIEIFDDCFYQSHNTRLVEGFDEPIYLPAGQGYKPDTQIEVSSGDEVSREISAQPFAQIVAAHGFFASGLHEVSHWCIAGEQRRQEIDYGYWYCPDGRTAAQQAKFEQAEIKPQALEWAFSLACGREFSASCDNLAGDEFGRQPDRFAFEAKIYAQLQRYIQEGFPARAQRFIDALQSYYQIDQKVLQEVTFGSSAA